MEYFFKDINLGKFFQREKPFYLIKREDILNLIKEEFNSKKLILIHSPIGYGKTTLCYQIIDELKEKDIKFIYYSINEDDKKLHSFFYHLIYGINQLLPNFGLYILELLKKTYHFKPIINSFFNEIIYKIKSDFVFIFDDIDIIQNEKHFIEFLNHFTKYTPSNIKMILSTCKDINFDFLNRLKIENKILFVSKDLLSFNEKEIKEIGQNFNIYFSDFEANLIRKKTDGWILYLIYFLNYLKKRYKENTLFEIIEEIETDKKEIFNYIENEIFKKLNKKEKKFLIFYSYFENIKPSIFEKILNIKKTENFLYKIYKQSPYLIEKRNNSYILHFIFKEFLKIKINKKEKMNLFNKIGYYFEKRKDIKKSMEFYLNSKNFDKVAKLFLKYYKILIRNKEYILVKKILDDLPLKYYEKYPILYYYKANISIILEKKTEEAEKILKILEKKEIENKEIRIKALKALINEIKGEIQESLKIYEELVKEIKEKNLLKSCLINLGTAKGKIGKLKEAKEIFKKIYEIKGIRLNIFDEITLKNNLFVIELEMGNYKIYQEILNFFEKYHLIYPYNLIPIAINLISLEILLGKINEAQKHIEWFFEKAMDTQNDFYKAIAYKFLGDIESSKGNYEKSEKILEKALKIAEGVKEAENKICLSFIENFIRKKDIKNLEKWINIFEKEFQKEDLKINFYKGKLNILKKEYEKAKIYLENCLNQFSHDKFFNTLILWNIVIVEYNLKNYEKAIKISKELKKIIEENEYDFLFDTQDKDEVKIIEKIGLKEKKEIFIKEEIPSIFYVSFFGNFKIFDENGELKIYFRSNKILSLFAFLIYKSQFYNSDILIDMYWREIDFENARNNLYVAICNINNQFKNIIKEKIILKTKEGYGINPEIKIKKDTDEFEKCLTEARNLKGEECIEILERAKKIYKGDFLQNLYDFWVEEKKSYYKNLYLNILENLGKIYKEKGEDYKAIINYEEYLKINPYNEKIIQDLIEIYEKLKDFKKILKLKNLYRKIPL